MLRQIARVKLCRNCFTLCTEIDEKISTAVGYVQGVMGHCPAICLQRWNNSIVVDILRRH